jgi:hypothetical protein
VLEVVHDEQRRLAGQSSTDRLDRDLGDAERAGHGVEHVLRFAETR